MQLENPNRKGDGENKDINSDDDFMRKLGTLKWNGETPTWLRPDLLNRRDMMNENDVKQLQQEIERIKVEKADLAVHFSQFLILGPIRQNPNFVETSN